MHHAEVFAGHYVARSKFGTRIHVFHVSAPVLVQQYRAFASHGFGDEEVLAHGHGGGMELVELQVGNLCPRTPCGGNTISSGNLRIGGVRVHASRATSGQNHAVGGKILVLPVNQQPDAGNTAVTHDKVFEEGMFDDMDTRILTHHAETSNSSTLPVASPPA